MSGAKKKKKKGSTEMGNIHNFRGSDSNPRYVPNRNMYIHSPRDKFNNAFCNTIGNTTKLEAA